MPADGYTPVESFYGNTELPETEIQEFYRGKTIFITGGTGFLGKLLIEKLIHVCPAIKKIYLLVRNKKGKDLRSRIEDICNDVVFERVKRDAGPISHYLRGIPGDLEKKGLGLLEEDRALLESETEIVFHVAATVRFDEELKKAIEVNVRATMDVIQLMKQMKHLQAAIHVSTAYSNCTRKDIEEKFYCPGISCDEALSLTERDCNLYTDNSFLRGWPNTYTFTKAIAEDALRQYAKDLPIGIFRPSMITGTSCDGPLSGWIDNQYGPTGAVLGVGCGLIRTIEMDLEKVADLVPGDMCANAVIAAAWSIHKNKPFGTPIYNYVSSPRNPITWAGFLNYCLTYGVTIPPEKGVWCMCFIPTKSHWIYVLLRLLLHSLPAFFIDIILKAKGSKIRMQRVYRTVHKFSEVITFFSCNEWVFGENNIISLWSQMSIEDRKLLPFNIETIKWPSYLQDVCNGARAYLVGEDISNLARARVKYRRYVIMHNGIKLVLVLLFGWLAYSIIFGAFNYFNVGVKDSIRRIQPHQINI